MKQTFRTLWIGELSPYRQLCFRSFLYYGHALEVFTYDDHLDVPDGVVVRDAREVVPGEDVLRYANDQAFGPGSPALHSDLFRFRMLEKLGGWWVDSDIVLLRPEAPTDAVFIANESAHLLGSAVLKAPPGHDLFRNAACIAAAAKSSTLWAEIGPMLLTRLVADLGLQSIVGPRSIAYEIRYHELWKLFVPDRRGEVEHRLRFSPFCHLWNQGWRNAGVLQHMAPPRGSFLDGLSRRFGVVGQFSGRMELDSVHTLAGYEAIPDGAQKPFAAIEGFRSAVLNASVALQTQAVDLSAEARCRTLADLWSAADRLEESAQKMADDLRVFRAQRSSILSSAPKVQAADSPPQAPGVPSTPALPARGGSTDAQRHVFRCFWHGSPLSPYEQLSIASLRARGHRVVLYRYDPAIAAPDGVEVVDARDLLPTEAVITHTKGRGQGSYALHADILRLLLMESTGDWWIDLDMVLLTDSLPSDPMVFFLQGTRELVNIAVARAPAGSAFLREALESIDLATIADADWGSLNPIMITEILHAYGFAGQARPAAEVFPVPYREFEKLFMPSAREEVELRCRDALFVHLWHDRMRRAGVPKWIAPPAGSYVDALFRHYGIGFPRAAALEEEQIVRWSANLRATDAGPPRTERAEDVQPLQRQIAALAMQVKTLEAERAALRLNGNFGRESSMPDVLPRTPA